MVRDHRNGGTMVVRDHRGEGTVVAPPLDPTIVDPGHKQPFPGGQRPPVGPIKDPVADPNPPQDPPKPPQDPPQHDHPKPHFGWQQFLGFGFGNYPRTVVVERPVYVSTPVTVAPLAAAPVAAAAAAAATLEKLSPGMDVRIAGQDFGAAAGRAAVKIGDLMLPAEIVEWQADGVIVRLPVMLVAKPMPAELLLARADGTPAQPVAFELAMAAAQ